jgi:hypothetical protein
VICQVEFQKYSEKPLASGKSPMKEICPHCRFGQSPKLPTERRLAKVNLNARF